MMNHPKKLCLLLALFCCTAVGTAAAAMPASGEAGLTAEAPLFVPSAAGKEAVSAKKDNAAAGDAKENKKGKDTMLVKPAAVVTDDTLALHRLTERDFTFNGMRAGDSLQKVKAIFGSPTKYAQSDHYTELKYDRTDLRMRVRLRNEPADFLKEAAEGRKAVQPGVESVTLASGDAVYIGPGIHLGHPAELLVRKYGAPLNVLRDADANVYYFVYANPSKDHILIFAIGERKVARVALIPPRPPYVTDQSETQINGRSARDFTLVGYGVNEPFVPNKYNMWTNMVKRGTSHFWLYGSYGLEVDRHNMVKKVFLLNNSSFTGRGATLGYRVSTLLALYGQPDRIEKGPAGEEYVDAYYYDSPFQKGVSLVFINKHATDYIDDVLLISEPIKNIQDPMERYGLKDEE